MRRGQRSPGPVGRHAKPQPGRRSWPWPVEYLLEHGRANIWGGDETDQEMAMREQDPRRPPRPLGGAWWDDWAQPRVGRAFFASAGVTGLAIAVATVDTLPTWIRLTVPLIVLGALTLLWARTLQRWLRAGRPRIM